MQVTEQCRSPLHPSAKAGEALRNASAFFLSRLLLSNSHTLQTQPYCLAQHGIGLPAHDSVAQHRPSADKKQDLKYGLF